MEVCKRECSLEGECVRSQEGGGAQEGIQVCEVLCVLCVHVKVCVWRV